MQPMNLRLVSFHESSAIYREGVIHKLRGQLRGTAGVSQMAILLHKPYLVKVTTKGEGDQ